MKITKIKIKQSDFSWPINNYTGHHKTVDSQFYISNNNLYAMMAPSHVHIKSYPSSW